MLNSNISSRSKSDFFLLWFLRIAAALAGVVALIIAVFLIKESLPVLTRAGMTRFFNDASWNPSESLFNLTPMLWGSLFAMVGSVLLAAPLGILSAVFCHYYAPSKLAEAYRRVIELLAGIPSVVFGFWGLVVLVPMIGRIQPPGASLLAGILILAVMILPTIALVADSSLANVPKSYRDGAAALGLSRWTTIRHVVFPAAKSGFFTGIILGSGRALGETMAVMMVCGNVVQTPKSLFEPVRTLTANMALEMAYALDHHRSALFVSGLILMGLIILLVAAAEVVSREKIYG